MPEIKNLNSYLYLIYFLFARNPQSKIETTPAAIPYCQYLTIADAFYFQIILMILINN